MTITPPLLTNIRQIVETTLAKVSGNQIIFVKVAVIIVFPIRH